LGTALATAEPLVGLGAGEVGKRDIAILDNEQSNWRKNWRKNWRTHFRREAYAALPYFF
jgi:hypothetical protein